MRQLPSTLTPELYRAKCERLKLPQQNIADLLGIQRTTHVRYLAGRQPIPLIVQRCLHYLEQSIELRKQIDAESTYDALLKTIRTLP